MIKLVVFDFDGVIIDSAHECFVVCQEIVKRLGWKSIDKLEKQFLEARSFVLAAEDCYYIVRSFNDNLNIDFSNLTQEEFEKLKLKLNGDFQGFVKLFYEIRYDMQKKDIENWLKLHRLYPGVKEAFSDISKKYKIAIATTKDKKSALDLLKANGLYIKENQITGRELAHDKLTQLKILSKNLNIKPEEIFFIEDMLQNLKPCLDIGCKGALVSWGYSNKAQQEEAKKLGIFVLKPQDLIKQIPGIQN